MVWKMRDSGEDDRYELEHCRIMRDSGKAVLVDSPEQGEIWIPKSQLHDDSIQEEGQEGSLIVTGWLAKQRGWL